MNQLFGTRSIHAAIRNCGTFDDPSVNEQTLSNIKAELKVTASDFLKSLMTLKGMQGDTRDEIGTFQAWSTVGKYLPFSYDALKLLRVPSPNRVNLLDKPSVVTATSTILHRYYTRHLGACIGAPCQGVQAILSGNWFSKLWTLHRLRGGPDSLSAQFPGTHSSPTELAILETPKPPFKKVVEYLGGSEAAWEALHEFPTKLPDPASAIPLDPTLSDFLSGLVKCGEDRAKLDFVLRLVHNIKPEDADRGGFLKQPSVKASLTEFVRKTAEPKNEPLKILLENLT